MKTVLHLIETSGPGGAENMLITMAESLHRRSYQSIICLFKDGWLNRQLQRKGFETVIVPQIRSLDFHCARDLVRLVRARNVSVMHSHEFAMNAYSAVVSALTGVACISTVHGKNYYAEKWRRRVAYRFVSKRSTLVAVSEDIRNFLIQRVGIKPQNVRTIWNGIDLDRYAANQKTRARIRHELGIPDKEVVIGAIGNLYPVKGHMHLVEAASLVNERYPGARLLIAGRGQMLRELRRKTVTLGISDKVVFLGFREDVADLLQAVDVFVLPSLSEGLPLSLLEAMASSTPVVATTVGGIPEAVTDQETGLLVEPGDSMGLANAILECIEAPAVSKKFAEKARDEVKKKFSVESMVNSYEELYKVSNPSKYANERVTPP